MVLFACDLDNTLIYSYKKDIGAKKLVEKKEDKELSFMTEYTYFALKKIFKRNDILFVPVTTRSKEQYERIIFPEGFKPKYAVVSNGGVLLAEGVEDRHWKTYSQKIVCDALNEMSKGKKFLETKGNTTEKVRIVDETFVYTKSSNADMCMKELSKMIDSSKVVLERNNEKIYIIPKEINKGNALLRLKKQIDANVTVACGDSLLDLPMLFSSDIAVLPEKLNAEHGHKMKRTVAVAEKFLLSDEVVKFVVENFVNEA